MYIDPYCEEALRFAFPHFHFVPPFFSSSRLKRVFQGEGEGAGAGRLSAGAPQDPDGGGPHQLHGVAHHGRGDGMPKGGAHTVGSADGSRNLFHSCLIEN